MTESTELSDVSDKPKPTDESKEDKAAPPEKSGGMATETKVGLLLVLVLLCAFGFMVWQKWNRAQQAAEKSGDKKETAVAHNNDDKKTPPPPAADDNKPPEQDAEPNPFENPDGNDGNNHGITVIPVNDSRTVDPFGEKTAGGTDASQATRISDPDQDALPVLGANEPPKSAQNLPDEVDPFDGPKSAPDEQTSVPEKTADASATDPFGDWEADTKAQDAKPVAAETPTLPGEQNDPFEAGPSQEKAPALMLETPEDSNSADPSAGPTGGGDSSDTSANSGENISADPFGERPVEAAQESNSTGESDPFGLPPKQEPASELTTDAEAAPQAADESDPFGLPANQDPAPRLKSDAGPELQSDYHEPHPLLETIPKDDRLGGFEEVTSGHATAGSTTQIEASPEFPGAPSSEPDPVFGDAPARISAASRNEPQEIFPQRQSLAPQPAADNSVSAYKVRSKDNYWSISRKVYGTSRYYRALAIYNRKRIPDPQKMRPGMQILVPPANVLEASYPELFSQKSPRIQQVGGETAGLTNDLQGNPIFVVGKGDTLSEIAHQHLGRSSRWIQIFALNRDKLSNPNDLKIGMSLKLPQDASRVKISAGDADSPLR